VVFYLDKAGKVFVNHIDRVVYCLDAAGKQPIDCVVSYMDTIDHVVSYMDTAGR
jgi:hypothetical protein